MLRRVAGLRLKLQVCVSWRKGDLTLGVETTVSVRLTSEDVALVLYFSRVSDDDSAADLVG